MTRDRPQSNVLDRVLSILEALAAADAERDGDSHVDVDYGVDVGTLADQTPDGRRDQTPDSDLSTDDDDAHATVRETEAGYRVVVDLPSTVAESDVTADVEDGTLVLSADGRPVERVPVALDGLRVTDMSVRNRIVEVTVEREEGG